MKVDKLYTIEEIRQMTTDELINHAIDAQKLAQYLTAFIDNATTLIDQRTSFLTKK
jgi:hypothetical protein